MEKQGEYVKGYNQGYLLAKHEPEFLLKIVSDFRPVNDYFEGFFAGKEEYELENDRKELDELREIREQGLDQERDDLEWER